MQKFIALGRLGSDPEIRDVQGTKVATFSLATSKKWTDKSGEKKEQTEWHNCVAWEKKAELIEQYVHKGDQLYIEGELKTDKYDKDGQAHYSTKIILSNMEFIGGKKETEPQQSSVTKKNEAALKPYSGANEPAPSSNMDDPNEDLPF